MGLSKSKPTKTLYLYTEKMGKEAILKSRYIKMSDVKRGDAILGHGVYLTSLSPFDHTHEEIAQNNWGTSCAVDRTVYVFEVNVSESNLKANRVDDRDIYLFQLENLMLYLVEEWTLYDWESDKPKIIESGKFHKGKQSAGWQQGAVPMQTKLS